MAASGLWLCKSSRSVNEYALWSLKGAVFRGLYLQLNNEFFHDIPDHLNGNIVVIINYPEVYDAIKR